MTEDISSMLDRAASSAPPLGIDSTDVTARGRRRARRRRYGAIGGAAAGVAAVTAAALALGSFAGGGTGSTPDVNAAAPSASTPATYRLPELSPGTATTWYSHDPVEDTESAEITAAVLAYFAEEYPDALALTTVDHETVPVPLADPTGLSAARYTNELTPVGVYRNRPPAWSEPMYRLQRSADAAADASWHQDDQNGFRIALDGSGEDRTDFLRLAVYPAGGYRPGHDPAENTKAPTDGYLVRGCEPYDVTEDVSEYDARGISFDCQASTGPNGERVESVVMTTTWLNHTASIDIRTVVVYRADGTAVVVSGTGRPGLNWKNGDGGSVPDSPTMSIEQLTDLALAVPEVTFPPPSS